MVGASFKWIPLALIAVAVTAAPVAAQQTAPGDQGTPQPVLQNSTELPPPFPHYPKRAPREHDPNYHRTAHKSSPAQSSRRAKVAHQARASHGVKASHRAKADRHSRADRHAAAHRQAKRQYFSKRTIRQCHAMSYQQIMKHSNCRTMMKQELADHPTQTAKHHATAHSRKAKRHRH